MANYCVKACPNCKFYRQKKNEDGITQNCTNGNIRVMEEWFENYGRLPLRARKPSMDLECYEPNYRVAEMEFRNEDMKNFMDELGSLLNNN